MLGATLRHQGFMTSDILIISDDEPTNRLMQIELNLEGYSVVFEQDSKTGFNTARTAKPKLVLLSEQAPGIPILELCHRLRSLSTTLKIILLTNTQQINLSDLPIDDFLLSPLRMDELLLRIAINLRKLTPRKASVLTNL
ncbi:MAG: response regulator [Cyanobacteria bacterium P01_F01_bin.53]